MGNCFSYSVDQEFAALWEALDLYWAPTVLLDTTKQGWRVLHVNSQFERLTGFANGSISGSSLWNSLQVSAVNSEGDACKIADHVKEDLEQMNEVCMEIVLGVVTYPRNDDRPIFLLTMRPNTMETLQNHNIQPSHRLLNGIYFGILTPTVKKVAISQRQLSNVPGIELGPVLGKGSFGTVFKAVWQHQIVAAKVMKVDMSDDKGIPLEVVLASQMLHPHIVQLFTFARSVPMNESTNSVKDVPQEDAAGTLTLVMEYCNAGSLMAAIHNGEYYNLSSSFERVPDLQAILATAIEIASGLAYMHSKGIVHGDLTAHNILLQSTFGKGRSSKKIAKIADFGLSRALTASSHETLTHGTVSHMAPELLEMGQMSKASDIYSFGVLLYELCSGQQAWEGFTFYQIIYRVTVEGRRPEMQQQMPWQLKALMEKCMCNAPDLRPTAQEMVLKLSFMKKLHYLQRSALLA